MHQLGMFYSVNNMLAMKNSLLPKTWIKIFPRLHTRGLRPSFLNTPEYNKISEYNNIKGDLNTVEIQKIE